MTRGNLKKPVTPFSGRILVIGCGAVSQCTLPILLDLIDMPADRVTVMDFVDNRTQVKALLERGMRYVDARVTKENYTELLPQYVSGGDIIIDLAWNIETQSMLEWCHEQQVLYVNTSVEEWDPYADSSRRDPRPYTLYARQMQLRSMVQAWESNNGATAIVDHGANPGLVSHFTKMALCDIATRLVEQRAAQQDLVALERELEAQNFNKLAQLLNVQVIHISERDTQISSVPKIENQFVNTWSVAGLYEEAVAPAELGWGTHEKYFPAQAYQHETGPRNQICLNSLGMNTWARSWVPCGEIVGMIIRHGEAYGISDRLTVWEGSKAVYRPTVHYVYCPSDSTIASLHELKMRNYDLQSDQVILNDQISEGRDELGVLLMGHAYRSWWTGSLLDIHETRELAPGQNATTLQVAISVIAAAVWAIQNPKRGLCLPDDVDHRAVMQIARPYLGPMLSQAVDWSPLDSAQSDISRYGAQQPKLEDCWQFKSFLQTS